MYNINYWNLRNLHLSHEKLVETNIQLLYNFHKKGVVNNFSNIRNTLLINLLECAKKNSPFYKKVLPNKLTVNDFSNIPFLTKQIIRENEQQIKFKNLPPSMFLSRKTGGSTGEPLSFWATGNTEFLHQSFLFRLFGYSEGDRILSMDGTKIDDNLLKKNIYWQLKNNGSALPYGGFALSSLYLTKQNLELYVSFIQQYKPSFIRGYPSFITDIANYITENKINLDFRLKGVEVTSEICLEEQAKTIKKAFNTKVIGQYGHTEASIFAYTVDESYVYYCSPLYGFTEVIGCDNQHVKEGEEGEVVCTGFSSFGFPLIRYKTGDKAIYGGSRNGIVVLQKVLGRTADFLINIYNEKILLTALIFGQHFNAFSKIKKWQLIQNQIGQVEIIIEKNNDYTILDENEIRETFLKVGKINTTFRYDQSFIRQGNGKMRFVIQNLNN